MYIYIYNLSHIKNPLSNEFIYINYELLDFVY